MIKGFYFSQVEESGLGPRQKIKGQIEAFKEKGIDFELIERPFELDGCIRGNFWLRQIVCRLPFSYVYSKHIYEERFKKAEVFYVRFLAGDRAFVHFLKKLRKNNPEAIILMELADYPTTWYMTVSALYRVIYFPIFLKDRLAGRHYKKYIDRIVMPQERKEAFGIPVISFENGIRVSEIRQRNPIGSDCVRIIAVAGMCNFHGYDRLIEGLRPDYERKGKRNIEIHMVGGKDEPGNELSNYKKLCKKYGLEEKIIFYGEKKGTELDEIYDCCNLAVGSLGMYRIGYQMATSLKIREYLAKGLPIIVGSKVDLFQNENFDYYIEFENNSTPINFFEIEKFFDRIYMNESAASVNVKIEKICRRKMRYEKHNEKCCRLYSGRDEKKKT